MNCETIDSILDDHLVARLVSLERQRAAEHVAACARCSAAWAADDALRGETIAGPAPELFAEVWRRVAAAPVRREAAARSRRWVSIGGAAAAAAVVALVAIYGAGYNLVTIKMSESGARLVFGAPEANRPPAISATLPPAVAASPFVAGRDFEVLPAPALAGAVAPNDEVEVTEFFMYLCFPCYAFEADLTRWGAQAPSDVSLTRVPAMFNEAAELQARAFYTAEVLGKLDAMHAAFYDEIHARGNALASRAALEEFFQRFGVDAPAFAAAFDSSEVDARVQRAAALNREYAIRATPSLVVAGRYRTNPTLAGSAMLAVVDQLVAESRGAAAPLP